MKVSGILLFLVVILGSFVCSISSQGVLYGLVSNIIDNSTATTITTVIIDPLTGKISPLANNFAYIDVDPELLSGISEFDQKNNVFYFSTDFDSSYIFGTNINTNTLTAPFSFDVDSTLNILWDGNKNNLFVEYAIISGGCDFNSQSINLLSVSTNGGSSKYIANLTETLGLTSAPLSALDYNSYIYYVAYDDYISFFNIAAPNNISTRKYSCPYQIVNQGFIVYDQTKSSLVGIGLEHVSRHKIAYYYLVFNFNSTDVTCVATPIYKITGLLAIVYSLDPVHQIFYIGCFDNASGYNQLLSFNINTNSETLVTLNQSLLDIEVSYGGNKNG